MTITTKKMNKNMNIPHQKKEVMNSKCSADMQ